MSKVQIADTFLGRVSQFPDGIRGVPIDQADGSFAREEFYAEVMAKSPAQMKAYWSKIIFTGRGQPPKQVASSAELRQRIAEDATAIGYIDSSLVDDGVKVVH